MLASKSKSSPAKIMESCRVDDGLSPATAISQEATPVMGGATTADRGCVAQGAMSVERMNVESFRYQFVRICPTGIRASYSAPPERRRPQFSADNPRNVTST